MLTLALLCWEIIDQLSAGSMPYLTAFALPLNRFLLVSYQHVCTQIVAQYLFAEQSGLLMFVMMRGCMSKLSPTPRWVASEFGV